MTATPIGQLLSKPSRDPDDDPNPRPSTALPREFRDAVEAIFERFAVHYGAARMGAHWAGLDPEKAKSYWARKLLTMPRRNVGHALQYLPQNPPNIDEFLAICRRCPPPQVAGMLSHKPSPEAWAKTQAKAREVLGGFRRLGQAQGN